MSSIRPTNAAGRAFRMETCSTKLKPVSLTFITTDTNLRYQQNLSKRVIRILVLTTTSWPRIREKTDEVRAALENLDEGGYSELEM
jgi:hypothetical protein